VGQIPSDCLREAEDGVITSNSTRLVSTKERARGRWREILPALGIEEKFLTRRNCPCPICGGTDRFRFLDERGHDRDGMWVCNQCTPKPRPALELVMKFTGKPFHEAARMVDDIIGGKDVIPQTPIRPPEDNSGKSVQHKKAWRRGGPVRRGDVVDLYLRHRSVGMDIYPPCLRTSPLDWYLEKDPEFLKEIPFHLHHGGDYMHRLPAMFAAVTNPAGKHIATHRTFLNKDGTGKAKVSAPRKMAGPMGQSPTIRLMPVGPILGIAEGIETALSATRLFNIPTWSVICAHGIEMFEPPWGCRQVIVFADNDANGTSLRAAEKLRARLQLPVDIQMPTAVDTDWNDVLLEGGR
jgi:putative DNA primase/helicase